MKYLSTLSVLLFSLILSSPLLASSNEEPVVKKSRSGICHDKSSRSYKRTKNFVAYDSIQECLDSGGRLPKN